MVTGDNAQCGFYIAKECAMVAHHVQVLLADLNEAGRYMHVSIDQSTHLPFNLLDVMAQCLCSG
jgi:hypothetical protein